MSKKRRSEVLSVTFSNRQVQGWAFGLSDAFRTQLDIRLDERIDKEANKAKELKLGRPLTASEKLKRSVWTQGDPPSYAFDRGHIFHEVKESAQGLRRSIVVLLARPDAGALVESTTTDENGVETTVAADTSDEANGTGYVDFEILTYQDGALVTDKDGFAIKEQSSRTQAGFAELLRTGE